MDGATLNQKVQRGYALSALKVGTSYDVYRSAALSDPIQADRKSVV